MSFTSSSTTNPNPNPSSDSISNWLILSSYSIKKPITQPASGKFHFILMPFSTNPASPSPVMTNLR